MKLAKLSGLFYHIASFISVDMARQLYYAYGIELYGMRVKQTYQEYKLSKNVLRKSLAKRKRLDSATALHREY